MMKKLALLVFTFVSVQALAVEFKADSQLPRALQKKIAKQVELNCYLASNLTEVETVVRTEKSDSNGMYDSYFTTTFQGSLMIDQEIVDGVTIIVESAEYSFYNGDNTTVFSVKSPHGACL
ncbi:MAG: hypothetical protein ACAH59_13795 [Pseudobdellovibrionaceae bacterium]